MYYVITFWNVINVSNFSGSSNLITQKLLYLNFLIYNIVVEYDLTLIMINNVSAKIIFHKFIIHLSICFILYFILDHLFHFTILYCIIRLKH